MTLCASNLVFIVGVQTSKNVFKCETIAVLLHYFHLSTATWGVCHAFGIYNFVMNGVVPIMKYNNLVAYGASAVYVLVRIRLKYFSSHPAPIYFVGLYARKEFNAFLFQRIRRVFPVRISSLSPYQVAAMKFMIIAGCLCSVAWLSISWYPPPY